MFSIRLNLLLLAWSLAAVLIAPSAAMPEAGPEQASFMAPCAEGNPCAEVLDSSFDFGEVIPDDEISHSFRVRNTGPRVLEVDRVVVG